MAVEIDMQNSGLAASLVTIQFTAVPMPAVSTALFRARSNVSGAAFVAIMKIRESKESNQDNIQF
ncbi:hypothetical protein Q5O14_11105 [Eubacteriaceae bacterium ES2]|nr:hypothetical protein Q5O14_11105 [Eubacteriaceae bacterium ES2]